MKKEKKKKEKKLKKLKYKNLGTPVSEGVIANTLETMKIGNDVTRQTVTPPENDTTSSSSEEEPTVSTTKTMTDDNKKVFTGRPIKAIEGNRIRVRTSDGDVFEADRYCPHKKVDLISYGQISGRNLICTKHNWSFSLDSGGATKKGKNINACKVNDW
jgi:nitrite reductase/ring-hydroxylating ferredoxin subunit